MQSVSRSCQSLRVCGGDANVFSPRQVRASCEARRPISASKSPIYAAQTAGGGPAPQALHSKDSSIMLQQKEQQKSCRASTPRASPVAEAAPIQEARSPSASQSKKNGVAARPDSECPKVSKAGTILDPCYNVNQSTNIMWHETMTSRPQREDLLGQKGCVLWMTGLSGSGKSTLAYTLDHALNKMGRLSYVLDGDNIRHGLCNNLSFCPEDRAENNRRVAEVAKLFADCGIITIVSFISPYIKDRENCRKLLGQGEFIEVYLKTSIEVCEGRDPKGLYKKARAGEIKGFTGIDDPYEEPPNPEVLLNANSMTPEEMASHLLQYLENHGMLQPYCQGA